MNIAAGGFNLYMPPKLVITATGIIALGIMVLSVMMAVQQPWLGASLSARTEVGVRVSDVAEQGPSATILNPDDVILSIANPGGAPVMLEPFDVIEDPDMLPTFAERDRFRIRQERMHRILAGPVVLMALHDGREVRIQPQERRPLSSLPPSMWLLCIAGVAAMVVGCMVAASSRFRTSARWLILSAVGIVIAIASANVIAFRELALSGAMYPWLSSTYHLGSDLFTLGLIGVQWNYPRRAARFPLPFLVGLLMLGFLANETVALVELPGNSVLFQVPIYWLLGVGAMTAQWIKSRGHPLDRAAVKALIMAMGLFVLLISMMYFMPVFFVGAAGMSMPRGLLAICMFYFLLAVVVHRYRLFDIDRWWLEMWLWLLAGLAVMAMDVVLATLLSLSQPYALSLAVIAVGWLYFPLRQWAWARLLHPHAGGIETYIPMIFSHFVKEERPDSRRFWQNILQDVFHPLSVELVREHVPSASVLDHGLKLRVPCIEPECGMVLHHADRGGRLFNVQDAELAETLYYIAERAMEQKKLYRKGTNDERRRIMRDLHDDVGGRLLSLVHSAEGEDQRRLAGEALDSLREVIYFSFEGEGNARLPLGDLMGRWRAQVHERLDRAGVGMAWEWDDSCEEVQLPARDALNLGRMLYEAVSNALRHARPERIAVRGERREGVLRVEIVNDGLLDRAGARGRDPFGGKGIYNIRQRAEEMGGEASFGREGDEYVVRLTLPVEASDAHGADSGRS